MEKTKSKTKSNEQVKRMVLRIAILAIAIIVVVVLFNILGRVSYNAKYSKYTSKVEAMGVNKLYMDGRASDYKNVKNGEAVAMLIEACLNIQDIAVYGYDITGDKKYEGYLEFAKFKGLVPDAMISNEDLTKDISKLELLRLVGRLKTEVLKKELSKDEIRLTVNKAHKLEELELAYLKDAVINNVYDNSGSIAEGKEIKRGEFNKALCELTVSCSTITNGTGDVETDPAKLPSNSDVYAFILKDRKKEVYEKPFAVASQEEYESPSELFQFLKVSNPKTMKRIEKYMNTLINVDYQTITVDSFKEAVESTLLYARNSEEIEKYVEYVKANKIKLEGKVVTYMPCIYNDGNEYRIRLEVTLNVKEGNTLENVLLGDVRGEKTTYQKQSTFVVDYPVENKPMSKELYPYIVPMTNYIVK